MSTANEYTYLSSVRVSDAPEGMFARVLRHNCSGERYYAPPKPTEPARRSMAKPVPINEKGYAANREFAAKQPRWTEEREAAMPLTYHSLTRISGSEHVERPHNVRGVVHAYHVRYRCECGVTGSIPRSEWAGPSCPRACRACNRKRHKKAALVIAQPSNVVQLSERKVAVR